MSDLFWSLIRWWRQWRWDRWGRWLPNVSAEWVCKNRYDRQGDRP